MSGPTRVSSQQVTLGGRVRELRTQGRVSPTVRPTAEAVRDPATLARLLVQMDGALRASTSAPLSLPFLGGRGLTNYAWAANTAVLVNHGLGKAPVAYFPMKVRSTAAVMFFEPVWGAGVVYAFADKRLPTVSNGFYYECTVAGAAGAIEPVWPTTQGATIVDNAATWVCRPYASSNQILLMASLACVADMYIA